MTVSTIEIRIDAAEDSRVVELLEAHLATMRASSPPESVFALDLDGLRAKDVTFWTMWQKDDVVGCGALRELSKTHGEIKSMHTRSTVRGKGYGATMLAHILSEARRRGYARLSLETGSPDVFLPAQRLYERFDFEYCGAFPPYEPNPFSVFMTRELS